MPMEHLPVARIFQAFVWTYTRAPVTGSLCAFQGGALLTMASTRTERVEGRTTLNQIKRTVEITLRLPTYTRLLPPCSGNSASDWLGIGPFRPARPQARTKT